MIGWEDGRSRSAYVINEWPLSLTLNLIEEIVIKIIS